MIDYKHYEMIFEKCTVRDSLGAKFLNMLHYGGTPVLKSVLILRALHTMIFCRSVLSGDASILVFVFSFFVATSTRENTMLSIDNGHIAISIAAIAPIGNGFH
jgi:hypothetical protein